MLKPVILCLFLLGGRALFAADSLQAVITQKILQHGDTLEFSCAFPNYASQRLNKATLNVWIEDMDHHHRWKFRYPMLNGFVAGSLAIGATIPNGQYAVNFLVQRGLFFLSGKLDNGRKADSTMMYMMIPKDRKSSFIDKTTIARNGSFYLKNTLFADSAFFIFSPNRKVKDNYLSIHFETPLDSAFVPVCAQTQFITVGHTTADMSSRYHFDLSAIDSATLPEVVVTGHTKSKMQLYDEAYSSSMFQRNDAIVFDGLDNDQIARSISVLQFLMGRVPGLTIVKNEDGLELAKWRNEVAEIYVDEFRLDASELNFISPTDVAMIKVYRPPAMISSFSGGAGAIAIYTKKGAFANRDDAKHNFIVRGYTNLDSNWQ